MKFLLGFVTGAVLGDIVLSMSHEAFKTGRKYVMDNLMRGADMYSESVRDEYEEESVQYEG